MIGVGFVWVEFADHTGVSYIWFVLVWDAVILDRLESVGAFNALLVRICGVFANALAEAA